MHRNTFCSQIFSSTFWFKIIAFLAKDRSRIESSRVQCIYQFSMSMIFKMFSETSGEMFSKMFMKIKSYLMFHSYFNSLPRNVWKPVFSPKLFEFGVITYLISIKMYFGPYVELFFSLSIIYQDYTHKVGSSFLVT